MPVTVKVEPMEPILMTSYDHERLCELVEDSLRGDIQNRADIVALEQELERAVLVDESEFPTDVVTMNSKLLVIDIESNEELDLCIVFPPAADLAGGRISVLAPVGLAMLGSREGEEIAWKTPRGVRRLRVDHVKYQPEASGDLERLRTQFREVKRGPRCARAS